MKREIKIKFCEIYLELLKLKGKEEVTKLTELITELEDILGKNGR